MSVEVGKPSRTTIWVGGQDRDRADILIEAGLATTFSEAVRVGLALAAKVVDRIGASMAL